MKRIFFVLMLFSATSFAQEGRYTLKTHFGYSLSNMMWNGGETDFRSTFNAGVEVRRRMGLKGFYLQTGLRWNEYGVRDDSQAWIENEGYFQGYDFVYKRTYFFLSVPIIATFQFDNFIPGLSLSAGPQLSFHLFDKFTIRYEDPNPPSESGTSFGIGDYPVLSLGVHYALGYERQVAERWMLGGEAYYNLNLPIGWFFGLDGEYNFGLAINARYMLKWGENTTAPSLSE